MIRAGKLFVLLSFCLANISCQKLLSEKSSLNPEPAQRAFSEKDLYQNVIYGEDNRLEYYQITNLKTRALIDSTVVLVEAKDIKSLSSETKQLDGILLKDFQPESDTPKTVCKEEPFSNQATPGFCSGALVGKDIIMTAGHCINSAKCKSTKFVFGFAQRSATEDATIVQNSEIYSCKEVLSHGLFPLDYAFVRLDREVLNHTPLKLRSVPEEISVGQSLFVAGYPTGIPLKIATGARVRNFDGMGSFRANLDSYLGNSGSAVFNENTGEVEGILTEGEDDWTLKGSCYVSHRCKDTECRGETVTMASKVKPILDQLLAGGHPLPSEPEQEEDPIYDPYPEPETTGESIYVSNDNTLIPDFSAGSMGLLSSINAMTAPNGRKVYVHVNIKHPYCGDLSLKLSAPNGKTVVLLFRDRGSQQNLVGTFGVDLTSAEDLSELSSITESGTWFLHVEDKASEHTGTLVDWALIFE